MSKADTDHGYFSRNMRTAQKDRTKARQKPNRKRKKRGFCGVGAGSDRR